MEPIIAVEFLNEGTGAVIAASRVPVIQLPDTFAIATELDLSGEHYVVVSAEPATKAEFARTGKLTVRLRERQRIDPRDILFSLPTICGAALPETVERPVGEDFAFMVDDDFRQTEFIDIAFRAEIEAELADIRRIHEHERAQVGFKRLHARGRIPQPLPRGLTWARVTAALRDFIPVPELALNDQRHVVRHALAVRLEEDSTLWGLEHNGELTLLCVQDLSDATDETIEQIKTLSQSFNLAFVDWCSCRVYYPSKLPS